MKFNTPKFGPLSGVKVVFSAMEIAGPFSAQMLAEWGADVIWIENSKYPDTIRVQQNYKELSRRSATYLSKRAKALRLLKRGSPMRFCGSTIQS